VFIPHRRGVIRCTAFGRKARYIFESGLVYKAFLQLADKAYRVIFAFCHDSFCPATK
jgi:hypothetical protein